LVHEGTYEENVFINKPGLILRSSKGPEKTILQGCGDADIGIRIENNGITLEGFTIRGFDFGIDSFGNNNTIKDNWLFCSIDAIALWDSDYNSIIGNTIKGSGSDEGSYGIWLWNASNNSISDNSITDNTIGIYLEGANGNLIQGNTLSNNWAGLYLDEADDNEIIENTITDNEDGIFLFQSNSNLISGNEVADNKLAGISLESSHSNTVILNTVSNNGWLYSNIDSFEPGRSMFPGGGIGLLDSNDNKINHNSIFGNSGYGVYYENNLSDEEVIDVDATLNWWGDASGPLHAISNPGGLGNAVSDNVLFDPWWVNEVMTRDSNYVEPPAPAPGPDRDRSDFDDTTFDFAVPLLATAGVPALVIAEGSRITAAFVTQGTAADLAAAKDAYQAAQQALNANRANMTPAEIALAEMDLAVAQAAILAPELVLGTGATTLAAAVAAYQAAVAAFAQNGGLLSAAQRAEVSSVLAAVAAALTARGAVL
jgi:parallel beta-helix repeat protein